MSVENAASENMEHERSGTFDDRRSRSLQSALGIRPITPADDELQKQAAITWEQKFLAEDATEDPTINTQPLEAYLYYSARERLREENDYRPVPHAPWTVLMKTITRDGKAITPYSPGQRRAESRSSTPQPTVRGWMNSWRRNQVPPDARRLTSPYSSPIDQSKTMSTELAIRSTEGFITPHERETAYRLMRISSWQVVFYLIFTDMEGWYSAPSVFKGIGFGPGVLVYSTFYLAAFCCGQILWKLYMSLDSERYPIKSYGDLAERTYGSAFRNFVNITQILQLFVMSSTWVVVDGGVLSGLIGGSFCFTGLNALFAVVAVILSQMRTLRNVSIAAYINLMTSLGTLVLAMYGSAQFDPVDPISHVAGGGGEVKTKWSNVTQVVELKPYELHGWLPPNTDWHKQIAGVQVAVMAYGGATIFTEFMAEMRRPLDFWKAATCAQLLVFVSYLLYGTFVYGMYGQYTATFPTIDSLPIMIPIYLGCVILTLTIGLLHAHIACKMVYRLITRRYFKAPSLSTRRSRPAWFGTTAVFWFSAWLLGSAIPNLAELMNLTAAIFLVPMTYIIPPLLLLGHWVQRDAMSADNVWRPGMMPYSNRTDSFKSISRWKRGFGPRWYLKIALILIVASAIGFMGLGIYSALDQVIPVFQEKARTNAIHVFSCTFDDSTLQQALV